MQCFYTSNLIMKAAVIFAQCIMFADDRRCSKLRNSIKTMNNMAMCSCAQIMDTKNGCKTAFLHM